MRWIAMIMVFPASPFFKFKRPSQPRNDFPASVKNLKEPFLLGAFLDIRLRIKTVSGMLVRGRPHGFGRFVDKGDYLPFFHPINRWNKPVIRIRNAVFRFYGDCY